MKHVRTISKATPASASWFDSFTKFGELQTKTSDAKSAHVNAKSAHVNAKSAYVNLLFNTLGTLDPRDV